MSSKLECLMMIANAFNNMMGRHARTVMMPTTEAADKVARLIGENGFAIITVADATKTQLIVAMGEYAISADWGAFSRADWNATMKFLRFATVEDLKA